MKIIKKYYYRFLEWWHIRKRLKEQRKKNPYIYK